MATYTRYVDPNSTTGGDGTVQTLTGSTRAYLTLNAWEAAQQAAHGATDTDIVICSSNLDAGSGNADTTSFVIDGWTDKTGGNYIGIQANSSHGGKWNDNIYRHVYDYNGDNAETGFSISEDYVRLKGIQLQHSDTASADAGNWVVAYDTTGGTSTELQIEKCILRRGVYTYCGPGIMIWGNDMQVKIFNSIFIECDNGSNAYGAVMNWGYGSNCWVYNCTFHGNGVGVATNSDTDTVITNCLFTGNTTDRSGTGTYTDTYCATNLTSAGGLTGAGTGNRFSQTFSFVDIGAHDFHLTSSDTGAKDYGTSNPGSGLYSDDIDGVARSGSWDIGADEYVSTYTETVPYVVAYVTKRILG